jgi:hypothetical protein
MTLEKTQSDLAALKRYLSRKRFPVVGITVQHSRLADEMNAKKARQFAYTHPVSTIIYCSAAMERISPEARSGILLHEMAHIVAHAFDKYAELDVDDFCVSMVPEAKYRYSDIIYEGLSGWSRKAKAVEHVDHKFVLRLYK